MVDCPEPLSSHSRWEIARILSTLARRAPRSPSESSAPTLTRLSKALRFRLRRSAKRQKFSIDPNGPRSFRASKMGLTAPAPTFLMAESPKLMACLLSFVSSTVKSREERFTSGGRTGMPTLWHSDTAAATLSD